MNSPDARLARVAARQAASAQRDAVSTNATAAANRTSVLGSDRADAARAVFGSDLAHLRDGDRHLIHAATGEVIRDGQEPHERPLSAFAMQIAVDRRSGRLPADAEIGRDYLLATRDRLASLQIPANPFTGETLERALTYVAQRDGTGPDVRHSA